MESLLCKKALVVLFDFKSCKTAIVVGLFVLGEENLCLLFYNTSRIGKKYQQNLWASQKN